MESLIVSTRAVEPSHVPAVAVSEVLHLRLPYIGKSLADFVLLVDEKNFPSLPAAAPLLPVHSRVPSLQSFQSLGPRSSTPKVPPGFENAHAHPAAQRQESTSQPTPPAVERSTATTSLPTVPAVPILPIVPRTATPKPKMPELFKEDGIDDQSEEKQPPPAGNTKNQASEISLGSPKQKAIRQKGQVEKLDLAKGEEETANESTAPMPTKSIDMKAKKTWTNKPGKIEIPPTVTSHPSKEQPPVTTAEVSQKIAATPVLDSAVVGTPGSFSSPATPGTNTPSEPIRTSTRPRVLRVTTGMTNKVGEQTPASATTERSSAFPPSAAKRGSRRPSISSVQQSRPSTPTMSERPSHDVSRASSPPPSIVGSAPSREKSRTQQKKERRAKRTTEVSEAPSTASTPVIAEVAPVIARQKKKTKQREESSTFASESASPSQAASGVPADEVADKPIASKAALGKEQKDIVKPSKKKAKSVPAVQEPRTPTPESPREEAPLQLEEARSTYTVHDVLNEAAKDAGPHAEPAAVHVALQKLLQDHVSSMPKIISSLLQSGDLTKDHPWLNPPPLSSAAFKLAPDSRRGKDYLDGNAYSANDAFGHIYLPMKERQALKDGNAVSVADAGERKEDLLKRCLVTPNGWVLRHLSADDSEKVLDLEERRQMYVEEFGDVGTMAGLGVLEPDDYTNLGGGMEGLARQGERHGVVWIVGEDGQMVDDDDFDQLDDENGHVDGDIGAGDEEESEDSEDDDGVDDGSVGDGHLNMPGAWERPPRASQHVPRVGSGGRINSLPGLGPHSKTNALRVPLQGPSVVLDLPTQAINRSAPAPNTATTTAATTSLNTSTDKVNLRLLESDSLSKRIHESQRALETARKEMDKLEKMATKKVKDISRWREGIIGPLVGGGIKG